MFGYELQQFVMVSTEVWQDLHARYTNALWPWVVAFILLNFLVFSQRLRKAFFLYIACCWFFIGAIYFMHYMDQVHTYAYVLGMLFVVQGLLLLFFKVLRQSTAPREDHPWWTRFSLLVYCATAFLPLSYLLPKSNGSVLLFGWGAEQTALGTAAIVCYALRAKQELLLAVIPIAWIVFYALAL